MILFLSAQDIKFAWIGIVKDGVFEHINRYDLSPEQLLKVISEQLDKWNLSASEIDAVMCVSGPGSFTSTRTSTAIANTFGFTQNIPVYSIDNYKFLNPVDLLNEVDFSKLSSEVQYVNPVYDRPAVKGFGE